MRNLLVVIATLLAVGGCTEPEGTPPSSERTPPDVGSVSPALEAYGEDLLEGDLRQRPNLSPRDRSVITLGALIARNQTVEIAPELDRALENGLSPGEISEIITHLAFYAGWGNAMAAVTVAEDVFARRGVATDELPTVSPELLPLDEEAEALRAAMVENTWGEIAPGVVEYTEDVLFRELWLRPGLEPRDRSLVTVSALIAAGHTGQIGFHLNRAMDSGLTRAEASEALTHLAFYAGWPNLFSALPIARDLFQGRSE